MEAAGGNGVILIVNGDKRLPIEAIGPGELEVPSDWPEYGNEIQAIGSGSGCRDGWPGNGGAWSQEPNVRLIPESKVPYCVGKGGAPDGDGGDTWFGSVEYANAIVAAKGASKEHGGQASEGIGTNRQSGEDGERKGIIVIAYTRGGGGSGYCVEVEGAGATGLSGGGGGGNVSVHGPGGGSSVTRRGA